MKTLTTATLCILATLVSSGVALASAESIGKEEQAFRNALQGTVAYMAEKDFRSMPATAAGSSSVKIGKEEQAFRKAFRGTVAYTAEHDFSSMPATAAGTDSVRTRIEEQAFRKALRGPSGL
ncbi:hypothetical protein [Sedimenticola hydrogenitrophicus]|uniref:hypothetical protein n=1 Tax=Sedimenticola hydrogenitrophicus TaxID=2967975 RepID=UPI0023AFAF57|nr:hypothetical protein [Sedimenticola hydrogenitrophicus]